MILFAYASNMYFEDFATHIPSAKNLGGSLFTRIRICF